MARLQVGVPNLQSAIALSLAAMLINISIPLKSKFLEDYGTQNVLIIYKYYIFWHIYHSSQIVMLVTNKNHQEFAFEELLICEI